jgi:hypothetical protein
VPQHLASVGNSLAEMFEDASGNESGEAGSATPNGTDHSSSSEAAQDLNRGIRNEVQKLSERWSTLLHRSELWQRRLDDAMPVRRTLL